jgi:hypothetical protein
MSSIRLEPLHKPVKKGAVCDSIVDRYVVISKLRLIIIAIWNLKNNHADAQHPFFRQTAAAGISLSMDACNRSISTILFLAVIEPIFY